MGRIFVILFLTALSFGCTKNLFIEREPNISIELYRTYGWNKLVATNAARPLYSSIELNQTIIQVIDKSLAKKRFL